MADITIPVQTARLQLRAFTAADVDAVHAYHSLEEVARYHYWDPLSRPEVLTKVMKWVGQAPCSGDPDGMVFAVTLAKSGMLIGDMVLLFRDKEARQGEIGFSFNPAYGGHGYATEAATALLRIGFEDLKLHRILGRCDVRNEPSWRLMQRLGMRREAHFREHALFKGGWDEEFYYALLSKEWVALRQGAN